MHDYYFGPFWFSLPLGVCSVIASHMKESLKYQILSVIVYLSQLEHDCLLTFSTIFELLNALSLGFGRYPNPNRTRKAAPCCKAPVGQSGLLSFTNDSSKPAPSAKCSPLDL